MTNQQTTIKPNIPENKVIELAELFQKIRYQQEKKEKPGLRVPGLNQLDTWEQRQYKNIARWVLENFELKKERKSFFTKKNRGGGK